MSYSLNLDTFKKTQDVSGTSDITENVYEKEIKEMKEMNELDSSNAIAQMEEDREEEQEREKEKEKEKVKKPPSYDQKETKATKKNNFMNIFKKKKKSEEIEENVSKIYDSNCILSNPNNVDEEKYYLSFSELNRGDDLSDKIVEERSPRDTKQVDKSLTGKTNKKDKKVDKKMSRESKKKMKIKKKKKKNSSMGEIKSESKDELAQKQTSGKKFNEENEAEDRNYNFEPHEDLKKEIEKIKIDIDKIKKKGNVKRIYDDLKYILLFQNEIIDILIEDIRKNKLRTKYDMLEDSTVKDDVNKIILNHITLDLLKFKYINTKLKELILCVYDTKKFNSLIRKIVYNKLDEMKKIVDKNGELTFAKTMLSFLYKQLKYCLEEEVQSYYEEVKNMNDDIHNLKKNVVQIIFEAINNVCSLPHPNEIYHTNGTNAKYEAEQRKKQIMCPEYQKDLNSFFSLYDCVHVEGGSYHKDGVNQNKFKNFCVLTNERKDNHMPPPQMMNKNVTFGDHTGGVLDRAHLINSEQLLNYPPSTTILNHSYVVADDPRRMGSNFRTHKIVSHTAPIDVHYARKETQQPCTYVSNLKATNGGTYSDDLNSYYGEATSAAVTNGYDANGLRYIYGKSDGRRMQSNSNNIMRGVAKECSLFCNGLDKMRSFRNFTEHTNVHPMMRNNPYAEYRIGCNDLHGGDVFVVEKMNSSPRIMQPVDSNNHSGGFTVRSSVDVQNGDLVERGRIDPLQNVYLGNGHDMKNYVCTPSTGVTSSTTVHIADPIGRAKHMSNPMEYTGFEIVSSKEDIKKLETLLNDKWGSFKLFEKWVKDCSKWQWIDLKLQREYIGSNVDLEKLKEEKKKYLEKCINKKIKELWCGRMKGLMNLKLCDMEKKIAKNFTSNNVISKNIYEVILDFERSSMCYQDLYAKILNAQGDNKKISSLFKKYNVYGEKNSDDEEANFTHGEGKKNSISNTEGTKYANKKKGYVQSLIYSFNKKTHKQSNPKDGSHLKKENEELNQKKGGTTSVKESTNLKEHMVVENGDNAKKGDATMKMNTHTNANNDKDNIGEDVRSSHPDRVNNSYIYNDSYLHTDSRLRSGSHTGCESHNGKNPSERKSDSHGSSSSSSGVRIGRSSINKKENNGSFFDSFFFFKSEQNKKSSGSKSGSSESAAKSKSKSNSSQNEDGYPMEYSKIVDSSKYNKKKKKKKNKKSNMSTLKKIFYLNRKKKSKEKSSDSDESSSDNSAKGEKKEKRVKGKEDTTRGDKKNNSRKSTRENGTVKRGSLDQRDKALERQSSSDEEEYKYDGEFEYQILEKEVGDHLHLEEEKEKIVSIEELHKDQSSELPAKSNASMGVGARKSLNIVKDGGKEESKQEMQEAKQGHSQPEKQQGKEGGRHQGKHEPTKNGRPKAAEPILTSQINEDMEESKRRASYNKETQINKVYSFVEEHSMSLGRNSKENSSVVNKKANSFVDYGSGSLGEHKRECSRYGEGKEKEKNVVDQIGADEETGRGEKSRNNDAHQGEHQNRSKKNNSITHSDISYYSHDEDEEEVDEGGKEYDNFSSIGSIKKGNKKNKINKFFKNLGKFSFKPSKKKSKQMSTRMDEMILKSAPSVASNENNEEHMDDDILEKDHEGVGPKRMSGHGKMFMSKSFMLSSDVNNKKGGGVTKRKMSHQVDKLYSYINKLKEKKKNSTKMEVNLNDEKTNGAVEEKQPHREGERKPSEKEILPMRIISRIETANSMSISNENITKEVKENESEGNALTKRPYSSGNINKVDNYFGEKFLDKSSPRGQKNSPRFGYSQSNQEISEGSGNSVGSASSAKNAYEDSAGKGGVEATEEKKYQSGKFDEVRNVTGAKRKERKKNKGEKLDTWNTRRGVKTPSLSFSSENLSDYVKSKYQVKENEEIHREEMSSVSAMDSKLGDSMYSSLYLEERDQKFKQNISKKFLNKKKSSRSSKGSRSARCFKKGSRNGDENSSNSLDIVRLSSFKSKSDVKLSCSNSKGTSFSLSDSKESHISRGYMSDSKKENNSYYNYVQSILPFGMMAHRENASHDENSEDGRKEYISERNG
ncbi:conserved Plasmodium protein, unknown function [Plasmodium knowlesi strain H]|uniref:Uncharacterized protein n=3 Tax=Plasmodium knowlesi TaxID=5850 RepID=A0A5K1V2B2_PLAKH|nr:conserved Plasmodium protein, unknown function [Plasmodium knowlesi strain H]OTN63715.1 Uncharacterized protein PKNOH_S140231200 [Plasmodium knowlesi]CAA9990734.1 conserved Plasmodium protein, unknown function [Plasmodium knowlesi strain H]SBO21193.1 conserved Plasmodium protein, unknown function [Plasmodium knowlesi strain H]SBO21645.1 conserved Plasmodium protein, unknown function [Plasmodium knowlesi strain H]VVS80208.1 conserved Plasmodium protein, unknown function [Plasmodium knowlesi |eukprot:XP_002262023.1 hypothetical protein, conserved in Plasmodium species [Plasmodium knowlesi strain H]